MRLGEWAVVRWVRPRGEARCVPRVLAGRGRRAAGRGSCFLGVRTPRRDGAVRSGPPPHAAPGDGIPRGRPGAGTEHTRTGGGGYFPFFHVTTALRRASRAPVSCGARVPTQRLP
eukprot:4460339-Prymnesium_polylepis.1